MFCPFWKKSENILIQLNEWTTEFTRKVKVATFKNLSAQRDSTRDVQ